jgi:hypothetical protein
MNNKPTLLLLLIITLISCKKQNNLIEFRNELVGNTFDIVNFSENSPVDYEFKDSTYHTYQYNIEITPYSLKEVNGTMNIFLGDYECWIIKNDNELYDYSIIEKKSKDTLKLKKRKQKWRLEEVFGDWIDEKLEPSNLDSLSFYSLNKNQITYLQTNSKLDINNSNELLNMNLKVNSNRTEINWRIKSLDKNEMIIDRMFRNADSTITTHFNIKLIKKR